MEMIEILRRLGTVEKRKGGVLRDGMQIGMIRLVLFSDGSGEVQADWAKYDEEMCREEKLLHAIFSVDGPIFEFEKIEQLEAWLVEQSG
jgi:hypothetical protein